MNYYINLITQFAISNKYKKWYIAIIENSMKLERDGYIEHHHILPKSFAKEISVIDINHTDNIVKLSAKEHFICHRLLSKMFKGKFKQKMAYALHRLTYSNNGKKSEVYVSSRHYEIIRKQHSENLKGSGNPMFGRKHTNETKCKISEKASIRIVSEETKLKMSESKLGDKNNMYGKTHTQEVREFISKLNKGKRTGKDNYFFGKTHSDEVKKKLSDARKNVTKKECQHCKKMVDPSNYKRWHGDNCKFIQDLSVIR